MSLKPAYFDYLDHFGSTVTLGTLHDHPEWSDAIALRHDIDHDLDLALEVAHHEHARGLHATYFLLHSNPYWHDEHLAAKCRQLKAYGHEVALHVNVLTDWICGRCDDIDHRLRQVLEHLRDTGAAVRGVSAHGDRACYEHNYINYWLWRELRGADPAAREHGRSAEGVPVHDPKWQVAYPPDHQLRRPNGRTLRLWNCSLADHGLAYEAMHIPVDHYWTDTGGTWARSGDPRSAKLTTGRHQVLMHPYWWRGPKRIIFVLSTARAGSKWLANFVDRATSCRGLHEWTLNHRRADHAIVTDKRTNTEYLDLTHRPKEVITLIEQAVEHHRNLPSDVLESNVYLEPFAHLLVECGGDVTLVHLHRDGRDVVRSLLNRGWYDTPEDHRHREIPVRDWAQLTQFERCCWYHRFTNERLLGQTSRRMAFESMVTDRQAVRRWLATLGIVVHPLLADAEFPKRLNASKTRRVPPYAQWPEEYRLAFERICGPVQTALGYPSERADHPPTPEHPDWHIAPQPLNLMSIEPSRRSARRWRRRCTTNHSDVRDTASGLVMRIVGPEAASAHVMLARGQWNRMKRQHALAVDPNTYYRGDVRGHTTDDVPARLFVVFYDADEQRITQQNLASIRADDRLTSCAFIAPDGASHFAFAVHLGRRRPDSEVLLRSLSVRAIPISPDYRADLAHRGGNDLR